MAELFLLELIDLINGLNVILKQSSNRCYFMLFNLILKLKLSKEK